MLVLSRKLNESIKIGDDIVITVVSIQGSKIRLGIEAPRRTTVVRSELYGRTSVSTAKREAAATVLETAADV